MTIVALEKTEEDELTFEIPEEILDQLGWAEGTEVEFAVIGNSIRISKVAPEQSGVD